MLAFLKANYLNLEFLSLFNTNTASVYKNLVEQIQEIIDQNNRSNKFLFVFFNWLYAVKNHIL